MESLIQDVRYGIRMMLKSRAFTFVAVMTLALGIGANTAIFSAVEAIFLRPLPYPESDRLVYVTFSFPGNTRGGDNFSIPDFIDIEEQNDSFESVAAYQDWIAISLTGGDEPVRLTANFVSSSYFDIFKAEARLGRVFLAEENRLPDASRVVVLSHSLWQRQFGGDEGIIGKTVFFNQMPVTVVGVMGEDFRDLEETFRPQIDVWLPVGLTNPLLGQNTLMNRSARVFSGVARLRPEATHEQAQANMTAIAEQMQESYPDTNSGYGLHVRTLRDHFLGEIYTPLLLLVIGTGFVLLIGCVNVANLMLVRLAARRRELAVRAAIGASRLRLVRQLMVECVLIAAVGGGLGIVLAQWIVDLLVSSNAVDLPGFVSIEINRSVLAVSILLTFATGLVFGLVPALMSARVDLREDLNQSGRQGGALGRNRHRNALTIAELSLALVLLAGAGLMMKSFQKLASTGLGYPTENLVAARMELRSDRYNDNQPRVEFIKSLLEKTQSIGGVESATVWGPSDLGRGSWVMFVAPEGRPIQGQQDLLMISRHSVNPQGLGNLGISILQGRDFTWHDNMDKPRVAIISESLAKNFWPGEDALGKRFFWQALNGYVTVVGVAADTRHRPRFHPRLGALAFRPQLDAYLPYAQSANRAVVLALRTKLPPATLAPLLKETVKAIDSGIPVYDVKSLEDRLSDEEAPSRAVATLMSVYAGVALLLASLGVYGVLSHSVVQRTQEFGIRMALGANRKDILLLVLRRGLALVMTGAMVGLGASFALTRFLSSLLFGTSPTDPATLALISILLIVVAVIACYIPARRATRVDPLTALKYE